VPDTSAPGEKPSPPLGGGEKPSPETDFCGAGEIKPAEESELESFEVTFELFEVTFEVAAVAFVEDVVTVVIVVIVVIVIVVDEPIGLVDGVELLGESELFDGMELSPVVEGNLHGHCA
jgi:hypothetical protein